MVRTAVRGCPYGFTNKSLRALVAGLLGRPYSQAQMTYDLRRLGLKGLIVRVPHTNSYALTTEGLRVAIFYTKLDHRLLHPLLANSQATAPLPCERLWLRSTAPSLTTSPRLDLRSLRENLPHF